MTITVRAPRRIRERPQETRIGICQGCKQEPSKLRLVPNSTHRWRCEDCLSKLARQQQLFHVGGAV